MSRGLRSDSNLSHLDKVLDDPEHGILVASKHLGKFIGNKGLIITTSNDQTITKDFWRGYLSVKHQRLKRLSRLYLEGMNDETAKHLAEVMHDMNIRPYRIFFNGVDVNAA